MLLIRKEKKLRINMVFLVIFFMMYKIIDRAETSNLIPNFMNRLNYVEKN